MLVFLNVFALARGALVGLFVGVTLLILVAGLLRRSRFSNVRMSWPTGRLFGLPFGPTMFMTAVLILMGYTLTTGEQFLAMGWTTMTAYVCGGLFWYVGSMLCSATIVTDWGISYRAGRRHVMLRWHEVTDYVATQHRRRRRYVFFKIDARGYKQRMEVFVPWAVRDRFQSLVEFRLDTRFDRSIQRPMGQQALEQ